MESLAALRGHARQGRWSTSIRRTASTTIRTSSNGGFNEEREKDAADDVLTIRLSGYVALVFIRTYLTYKSGYICAELARR